MVTSLYWAVGNRGPYEPRSDDVRAEKGESATSDDKEERMCSHTHDVDHDGSEDREETELRLAGAKVPKEERPEEEEHPVNRADPRIEERSLEHDRAEVRVWIRL